MATERRTRRQCVGRCRQKAVHGPQAGGFTAAVVQRIDDYESNSWTTGTVTVGGSASGRIDSAGDVDWFAVELASGKSYDVTVSGDAALGAQLTGVYNEWGTAVSEGVSWSGPAALIFAPSTGGSNRIAVAGTNEATGAYTVSVVERSTVPSQLTTDDQGRVDAPQIQFVEPEEEEEEELVSAQQHATSSCNSACAGPLDARRFGPEVWPIRATVCATPAWKNWMRR